jgi:hypothetical protein
LHETLPHHFDFLFHLIVFDIEAARAELARKGIDVSEIFLQCAVTVRVEPVTFVA